MGGRARGLVGRRKICICKDASSRRLQHPLAVVLECVVQARVVAACRADNQVVEVGVDGRGRETEGESFAEPRNRVLSKERETVELRVLLHELDNGWALVYSFQYPLIRLSECLRAASKPSLNSFLKYA